MTCSACPVDAVPKPFTGRTPECSRPDCFNPVHAPLPLCLTHALNAVEETLALANDAADTRPAT